MENRRNFHFQQSTTRPNTLKESQERSRERVREAERVRALGRARLVIQKNVVKCATQYLRKPTKTYDFSPCRKNTNLFALRFVLGQPLNLVGKTYPTSHPCPLSSFYPTAIVTSFGCIEYISSIYL